MRVSFDERIQTDKTPDQLWATLQAALADSCQVEAWPNRLSRLQADPGGETLSATYGAFRRRAPTYKYDLDVREEQRTFKYTAIERQHPFSGGATVRVEERNGGADLVWSGAYEARLTELPELLAFRIGFAPLFFRKLRKGLTGAAGQ